MIFIDVDGVLIDFYGTAKKFGIELEINKFGLWQWGEPPYPAPEEFYAKAELQPWTENLMAELYKEWQFSYITKDYEELKYHAMKRLGRELYPGQIIKAPNKSIHCKHPTYLLIDDCEENCVMWRAKGGIAYWFNLEEESPFEKFLNWWRLE